MTEITYINERIFKNIKKSQQAPDFKILSLIPLFLQNDFFVMILKKQAIKVPVTSWLECMSIDQEQANILYGPDLFVNLCIGDRLLSSCFRLNCYKISPL